jgi:hypothetical protein
MGHSIPASEPSALIGGLVAGFLGYLLALWAGADQTVQMWVATIFSVIANLAIGAPINVLALDILAFVIVRPLSPIIGAKLLSAILF